MEEVIILLRSIHKGTTCTSAPASWRLLAVNNLADQHCAWALTNDIPAQLSNFGGEQAAWGLLELTNYGFDHRYHTPPTSSPTLFHDLARRGPGCRTRPGPGPCREHRSGRGRRRLRVTRSLLSRAEANAAAASRVG